MCVSTHSRPKAAGTANYTAAKTKAVSTHSRPKAAGLKVGQRFIYLSGFNTQPPEGGWTLRQRLRHGGGNRFNTQPPEGGWFRLAVDAIGGVVSTHSRPKAAGFFSCFSLISIMFQHTAARRRLVYIAYYIPTLIRVSTHSRPKAAGFAHDGFKRAIQVSTHSRPKAAGSVSASSPKMPCSFNTQPPEGGWDFFSHFSLISIMFQHTAARRRLEGGINSLSLIDTVSTHSRPKAAGTYKTADIRIC